MTTATSISRELKAELKALYEEIRWLADRPGVSPSEARAWYTHVRAVKLRRGIRRFSGKISVAAASGKEELRLEHYERIQTRLTKLIELHARKKLHRPEEFIRKLVAWECVHIVTRAENYAAMRHDSDYMAASIKLIPWTRLPPGKRQEIWKKVLKGRVCNAAEFKP